MRLERIGTTFLAAVACLCSQPVRATPPAASGESLFPVITPTDVGLCLNATTRLNTALEKRAVTVEEAPDGRNFMYLDDLTVVKAHAHIESLASKVTRYDLETNRTLSAGATLKCEVYAKGDGSGILGITKQKGAYTSFDFDNVRGEVSSAVLDDKSKRTLICYPGGCQLVSGTHYKDALKAHYTKYFREADLALVRANLLSFIAPPTP